MINLVLFKMQKLKCIQNFIDIKISDTFIYDKQKQRIIDLSRITSRNNL